MTNYLCITINSKYISASESSQFRDNNVLTTILCSTKICNPIITVKRNNFIFNVEFLIKIFKSVSLLTKWTSIWFHALDKILNYHVNWFSVWSITCHWYKPGITVCKNSFADRCVNPWLYFLHVHKKIWDLK